MNKVLLIVGFILSTISGFSQFENVMISDVFAPMEPVIVMDQNQPGYFVAGSSLNSFYISLDTGITWEQNIILSDFGVWGDPAIVVDSESNFYFFHLSNPYEFYPEGDTLDRIVCQKTINNAISWSNGTYFGLDSTKDNSKEWAVVDLENDNIYVTWTQYDHYKSSNANDSTIILFTKSVDAGITWSEPLRINKQAGNCLDSDSTVKGAVPAIGPNGDIFVAWAGPEGLLFDRSTDEGATWLEEDVFIDSIPGGWDFDVPGMDRCNGLPITKCDISGGPNDGAIYVNWADQRNGEGDTDIWLSKSMDNGNTWSEAIRVNDDVAGKHQFLTWMDIDQTNGHLYFVFYDRREHEGNATDVYMARSTDGGSTFENFAISDSSFIPTDSISFGDYINVAAYDGIIRPVWTRLQNGELSIWTALVNFSIWSGITEEESVNLTSFESYPNPAKEELNVSFVLKAEAKVSLQLFDANARLVSEAINNKDLLIGEHSFTIDLRESNLKSGMYFLSLQVGDTKVTEKIIIE